MATPTDKAARWAQQVQDDIQHGTDITGIGSVMQALGSHGIDNSDHPAVAKALALVPLGILKAIKGQAEMSGAGVRPGGSIRDAFHQGLQGLGDELTGEGKAAPAAVAAPFAAAAAPILGGAALKGGFTVAKEAVKEAAVKEAKEKAKETFETLRDGEDVMPETDSK